MRNDLLFFLEEKGIDELISTEDVVVLALHRGDLTSITGMSRHVTTLWKWFVYRKVCNKFLYLQLECSN